jgi:small ligand-binding sensory domain FIST
MIEAGVGISSQADAAAAGAQAAGLALEAAPEATAALVFAGPGYGDDIPLLLDAAAATLRTEVLAGASTHGVLGAGREHEGEPAVAVLAVSGLEAVPFLIPDPSGDEVAACDEIARLLGAPLRPEDLVVLLPDPRTFHAAAFLPALARALGPARVVGAGAGDPVSGEPLQWCGRTVASGGVSGILLRGARPRIGVTQACRPATELLTVTRARGHWVLELDGRPALEVFREAARGPLAQDLRRAAAFVLAALPVDPGASALEPGAYLVRQIVGFETNANAFALPVQVQTGSRLALAQREPQAAREDLKAMLERLGGGQPAFGLYFDCCARGSALFGMAGLEAGYLESTFGATPIAGLFGSCEIGPVGPATELLTYTGVLALVDRA